MKTYIVTITTTGYTYNAPEEIEFDARDANHAMKQARKMMYDNGHTRHDGPLKCSARVKKD